MKLALFFLLSFALHAAAFLAPITFNGRTIDSAITVTILPLESAAETSGGAGAGHAAGNRAASPLPAKTPVNERSGDATPATATVAQEKYPVDNLSGATDSGMTALAAASTVGILGRSGESSASGIGGGSSGLAGFGTGSGNGSGQGEGSGTGKAAAGLTQVRYRETSQPHYPESARRDGKEGRVLLRVLVDEEGKTKAIEVSTSSGHDLLDRAAADAIKKWRFVPARAGTKAVETWVKIPIEFQLSHAKP